MSFRMSKQRQVILEELRKVDTHPTADEVYDMVRRRLPRISLGTVYRNLEFLSEKGLVLRLGGAGSQKRFDGTPEAHPHMRCRICSKVCDVHAQVPMPQLEDAEGWQLERCDVDFIGICPECAGTPRA